MAQYGSSIQRTTPIVLNLLIINGLVYVAQKLIPGTTEWGSLHYYQSSLFKPHQIITSMFMHDPGGFTHILFNMFALWMFGSILERFWGSKRFLLFYLICGVAASVFIELTVPFSAQQFAKTAPQLATLDAAQIIAGYKEEYSCLGASGAIMGVLAAFAFLFPNTKLYIMFIPIPIAAKFVIPGLVLIDLFGGFYQIEGDNVGHFAHLGGALVGIILVIIWNKTNRETFY